MNVLVDTSVWSTALRRRKQKLSSSLGDYSIAEELKEDLSYAQSQLKMYQGMLRSAQRQKDENLIKEYEEEVKKYEKEIASIEEELKKVGPSKAKEGAKAVGKGFLGAVKTGW